MSYQFALRTREGKIKLLAEQSRPTFPKLFANKDEAKDYLIEHNLVDKFWPIPLFTSEDYYIDTVTV